MQRENMPILAFFGKSFHKYIKLLIIFVITTFHLYASSYGKLRGHVKVYGTNDPLVGVNISIIGSYLGTITDAKGNYTILRIPPGVYDVRYEFIEVNFRGYVHGEDSLNLADDLSEDIDFIVNSFRNRALTTNSTLEISDALVLSVSTDEGLFDPYGLCDIRAQISYRYHLA